MDKLNASELAILLDCESAIAKGVKAFYETGKALLIIRNKHLYREAYSTFEEYCYDRWNISRPQAYRLMDASEVIETLSPNGRQLPENERQARPLARLEPEEQRLVWQVIEETAVDGKITSEHAKSVVEVLKEIVNTGAVDDCNGEQIALENASQQHLKNAITQETQERIARKAIHIRENYEEKERKRFMKADEKIKKTASILINNNSYRVILSSVSQAIEMIEPESIDHIVTDPPYKREYLSVYPDLAKLALHSLKPNGMMAVMIGQSYLPEIMSSLITGDLHYHWTLAYLTPGGQSPQIWPRKINTFWKPVLWIVKGEYQGDWIGDVAKSKENDNDKRFHHWGQSESGMADLLSRVTSPGDVILDPFMGGGTTGVVALTMKRKFIGIDCSESACKRALERLEGTIHASAS